MIKIKIRLYVFENTTHDLLKKPAEKADQQVKNEECGNYKKK